MRRLWHPRFAVVMALTVVAVLTVTAAVTSCGTAPTPFVVFGPGQFGNVPPTLTFVEPIANLTVGQGDPFLIRWTDRDPDDNASISFSLVNTQTVDKRDVVLLVSGIPENDTVGQDVFVTSTTLVAPAAYNLLGTINDGVNAPVEVFATVPDAPTPQRIIVTITGPGEAPQTEPPVVSVTQPAFNLSVAQEDVFTIVVQPTPQDPVATRPFDPDSDLVLYVLLDLDQSPRNDDPANPDPSKIIVLQQQTVQAGTFAALQFPITVDLNQIPARSDGEPYFIRATVDDRTNPRVHSYAAGTINVVQLAVGRVDLFDVGRTRSGVKFQGFNPGANLGSSLSHVSDFDADGIDDFVMVAQFGNPQNVGPVGEAYLVYGLNQTRFGGTIPVNSVADTVSGVIFQAPPRRGERITVEDARTDGITDVSFIRDLNNDGRPELLFGLQHVHGAYDSTDYDPQDEGSQDLEPFGCYPDLIVNNCTDADRRGVCTGTLADLGFYAGGMAVVVNSTNRDNDGLIRVDRLDNTVVALELVGTRLKLDGALDAEGTSATGFIRPRADNTFAENAGSDPDEAGRIAGARFIAGGYDYVPRFDPAILASPAPREGLFGKTIRALGDLGADQVDEIVISAPRNERYLQDLAQQADVSSARHLRSSLFVGSITVLPGTNYFQGLWRDINGDEGTAVTPQLDQWQFQPFGSCTGNPPTPRGYTIPADAFEIFAEDIDDMLGDGQSAGDFNRDGIDDILCGAPLNNRSDSSPDTGATYVIYGRTTFGEVRLAQADDRILRPPMLRVRGLKRGDQIGSNQTGGLDVNGDRIDDVFLGSPRTDFGGITRSTCAGDLNQDDTVNQSDLTLLAFDTCQADFGEELFTDDPCKVFDYDNDEDIDDDDRCIFCCLSGDCDPADDCIFGLNASDCCANVVDNGFVGIVFGGTFINGDRDISQIATTQLPGTIFFGAESGDRAGADISSAGDFNQDGFGDILIAAPGRAEADGAGRQRQGIVYLVFGGPHLVNKRWNLKDVGSQELPGIVFLSPYVSGRPNEAAPSTVGFIGDINRDGFGDIAIGNPKADFIDPSFPQGPDAPGTDPATGRRSDVGDVYVIYGNNFGGNRAIPP